MVKNRERTAIRDNPLVGTSARFVPVQKAECTN